MNLLPAHRAIYYRLAALVTVAFVLAMVATRWDARTGFTSLIRFGETLVDRQLPEVRALPVALAANDGYDGQYYAQLAVSMNLGRPDMPAALGNPGYRARRILLPIFAHFGGLGDPWTILQVYALINVAAWLALAWIWWNECPPDDATGFLRWAGATLALGTLDSVRMALTDLPCTLMLVMALRASRSARPRGAAVWLTLANLARETGVLGFLAIYRSPPRPDEPEKSMLEIWFCRTAAMIPIVAWVVWLRLIFPHSPSEISQAFNWPAVAWARHIGVCVRAIASGNLDSRYTFGLIAALGFAWQSIFILSRWRAGDPWARLAAPFALLFWVLGDLVWHGYWAVARVCLPMTIAYVRIAPVRAAWFLANLSAFHGLYRMLPAL